MQIGEWKELIKGGIGRIRGTGWGRTKKLGKYKNGTCKEPSNADDEGK